METMTKQFDLKHVTILDSGEFLVWGIYEGYKVKVSFVRSDFDDAGETFDVMLLRVNHVDVQRDEESGLGRHEQDCIIGVTSREEICSLMCKALEALKFKAFLIDGLKRGIKEYAELLGEMID